MRRRNPKTKMNRNIAITSAAGNGIGVTSLIITSSGAVIARASLAASL